MSDEKSDPISLLLKHIFTHLRVCLGSLCTLSMLHPEEKY